MLHYVAAWTDPNISKHSALIFKNLKGPRRITTDYLIAVLLPLSGENV